MSLKDKNIEEIFRTELEDLELPVDNSMWTNISNGITSGTTVSSAVTVTKVLTFLGLGSAAVAVGVAVGLYITSNNENPKNSIEIVQAEKKTEAKEEITPIIIVDKITEDQTIVQEIVKPTIVQNDPAITKEDQIKRPRKVIVESVNKEDEVVEDKRNNSWVNHFLTPVESSPSRTSSVESSNSESIVDMITNPDIVQVPDTIIESIGDDVIIASIVAAPVGGYAPLEVSFAQASESGTVSWDFGDGTTSNSSNPTHIFDEYGDFEVKLTIEDENGNIFEDYRTIEVHANSALTNIPNIFSPNNDGKNDFLTIGAKHLETYQIVILTSNGQILFESNDIQNSWDGRNPGGEYVPADTYVILIQAIGIDGKEYEHKGLVHVKY